MGAPVSMRHGSKRYGRLAWTLEFGSEGRLDSSLPIAAGIERRHQRVDVGGGARSGRRAADQPHRAAQSHAGTVRIGRKRLVNRGDGGRDDLCWLVAQPTVHGADLG
jgi:hypothetical protein